MYFNYKINNLIDITSNEFYKLISFDKKIKILLKEILITNIPQDFIFNEFKKIFGYTVIPYNGNTATSFIHQSTKNIINIKLNDTTTGHSTLVFVIGE